METLTIRSRSQDSVALWTKRITECKNSGMRVGDWCAENGINVKTEYNGPPVKTTHEKIIVNILSAK